jgi:hypothetical protein
VVSSVEPRTGEAYLDAKEAAVSYSHEVLRDLPAAYWRLGETAGTQARDGSPNGRHGTWSGGPALGQPGALDSDPDLAALFDGADDRITLPALPSFGTSLTIEFWFRPLSGGDATQCLIGEADGSPTVLFKSDGRLSVFYAAADHLNDTPLAYDTWHHIAIVISAGAGAFYLNGVADGAFASFPSGFAPDRIGDDTAGNTCKGYLDEVALYTTALAAERVAAHYAAAWRGLLGLRPRLRRELRDEDAAAYRWPDDELDRHLLRALDDLSDAWPEERATALTTTPGSRDLSIASLDGLVRIEAVEYPAGSWPPEYTAFSVWGDILTLLVDAAPSSATDVNIFWGARHRLDRLTSTVPPRAEDTLLLGAAGYALVAAAQWAADRVNVAGRRAPDDLRREGEERLRRFRRALRRFGDAGSVRVASLYTPARPEPTKSTVHWP